MATESKCIACARDDSWRHFLLECRTARCVWVLVDEEIYDRIRSCGETNAKNCLFEMEEQLNHNQFVILWLLSGLYGRKGVI